MMNLKLKVFYRVGALATPADDHVDDTRGFGSGALIAWEVCDTTGSVKKSEDTRGRQNSFCFSRVLIYHSTYS